MAQPPSYERQKNFADDFGNETDHSALNAELDRASNSINDIRTNLALVQADDGKIRASSITTDSLDQEVLDYVQEKALAGANAVADAATAIAREAQQHAASAVQTAFDAVDKSEEAVATAEAAQTQAQQAETKAAQALSETAQIDSKVTAAVDEALHDAIIPGLTPETIAGALGYVPYDAETNNKDFATSAEVAEAIEAIPEQVNADWNATEGKAQILNKPTAMTGATAETAGKQGFVPAPEAGDQNKVLTGSGEWKHASGVPIGFIGYYGATTPPAGYLKCDGAAVGRETYPELFAAIGTTFGAGDGKTTFNLPNLIGRFAEGSATPGTSLYNPIYGASDTVQPPALTLLPCIKAFDAAIDSGLIDITELANEVAGKADKTQVANLAMPSDSAVALTIPSSGSSITAPADGYINFTGTAGDQPGSVNLYSETVGSMVSMPAGYAGKALLPVREGAIVNITYTNLHSSTLYFVYAEGSRPV